MSLVNYSNSIPIDILSRLFLINTLYKTTFVENSGIINIDETT
jgi:hypothetical protein